LPGGDCRKVPGKCICGELLIKAIWVSLFFILPEMWRNVRKIFIKLRKMLIINEKAAS
jgi:hypothetical protein